MKHHWFKDIIFPNETVAIGNAMWRTGNLD
jgi:hypothetical protein